jgi:hypothetical protein
MKLAYNMRGTMAEVQGNKQGPNNDTAAVKG